MHIGVFGFALCCLRYIVVRMRARTGQSSRYVASCVIVSPATPFFWLRVVSVALLAVAQSLVGANGLICWLVFQNVMSTRVNICVLVTLDVSEYLQAWSKK